MTGAKGWLPIAPGCVSAMAGARWRLMPSDTAIQPVLVGGNADVLALAGHAEGAWRVGTGDPSADGAGRDGASAHLAERRA
jgi:hypothetical protein